jgi:ribA/ribD-fused uncharacterized protein
MNIVNVKTKKPYDIYCGRANKTYGLPQSKWANPYVIGVHGTRDEVIAKFRLRINCEPDLLAALPELKGKTLGCWCDFPAEDCHCRHLLEMADSKYIRNWFSNMLPFDQPFVYQGVVYTAVENFYQAMKMPKDRVDLRDLIAMMTPHKSKTAIRDREKFPWRSDWTDELALKAMKMALNHKFKKGTSWHTKLMQTEDWEIVEWNNWGDKKWGKDIRDRQGENQLGKLLMEIRSQG